MLLLLSLFYRWFGELLNENICKSAGPAIRACRMETDLNFCNLCNDTKGGVHFLLCVVEAAAGA